MAFTNLCTIPFSKEQIAIAISHSHMGSGHIGIAFHDANDGPSVLHLAWHRMLKVDKIPKDLATCWVAEVLSLPPMASKAVAAFVGVVARRQIPINYGINFIAARGSFKSNGKYQAPKGSDGLTCASYVVEVLRGAKVDLVRTETWPDDPANRVWGKGVCDGIKDDPDHKAAVEKNISGLRLRPFEIAGAVKLDMKQKPIPIPAVYEVLQEPAKLAEAELLAACPAPKPRVIVAVA